MTSIQRQKLTDAAIESYLENVNNGPAHAEVFLRPMLLDGHLGYAQMDETELLETVKNEIGYDPQEDYSTVDSVTEAMCKLALVIREIEKEN
jgi:hypothetical protein